MFSVYYCVPDQFWFLSSSSGLFSTNHLKLLSSYYWKKKKSRSLSSFWKHFSTKSSFMRVILCMRPFVFDWFDARIMRSFCALPAGNGLFVPLDFLSHTQLHLSCKSIPAAPRGGAEGAQPDRSEVQASTRRTGCGLCSYQMWELVKNDACFHTAEAWQLTEPGLEGRGSTKSFPGGWSEQKTPRP